MKSFLSLEDFLSELREAVGEEFVSTAVEDLLLT